MRREYCGQGLALELKLVSFRTTKEPSCSVQLGYEEATGLSTMEKTTYTLEAEA